MLPSQYDEELRGGGGAEDNNGGSRMYVFIKPCRGKNTMLGFSAWAFVLVRVWHIFRIPTVQPERFKNNMYNKNLDFLWFCYYILIYINIIDMYIILRIHNIVWIQNMFAMYKLTNIRKQKYYKKNFFIY